MNVPPSVPPNQDDDQLRMLAIAYRVVGGLSACCVNVFWLHFGMAITMYRDPTVWKTQPPPPSFMPFVLGAFVLALIFGGYALGVCGFVAARNLEARKGWTFCFAISILYLFIQPLGTVLGVLTLIVLTRPSVKRLLGRVP